MISDHKLYVQGNIDTLVTSTKAFTDAVKSGDLAKAKVSDADRKARAGPVTALAKDLSKLRGTPAELRLLVRGPHRRERLCRYPFTEDQIKRSVYTDLDKLAWTQIEGLNRLPAE